MYLPWLFFLVASMVATTLVGTNSLITPKTMITATNTTKPGCQRKCGNLTIPYPFGIGDNCSLNQMFSIICNNSYNPARASSVITTALSEILDITESQLIFRNTRNQIAWSCYGSLEKIRPTSSGAIDLGVSILTISHTSNKLTVLGCNDYSVFNGYVIGDQQSLNSGCIALCNKTVASLGSCPGSGCCQMSILIGLQSFVIRSSTLPEGDAPLSNYCSYAFLGQNGSFSFHGASDLTTNTSVVLDRITQQVPLVLEWTLGYESSCKAAKNASSSNESNSPYACQSNTHCIDTDTDTGGYRCSCLPGYEGNPYLQPGCTG